MDNVLTTIHKLVNSDKQKEKEEQVKTPQQQMRDHLTLLQNWGPDATDLNVAERRAAYGQGMLQRQTERNEMLQARAQAKLPKAKAKKKVKETPKQVQAPAKETFKDWRERKRQRKVAQQHNAEADEISYNMLEGLREEREMMENSLSYAGGEKLIEQAEKNQVDRRVLQCFVHGHRARRFKSIVGAPTTEREEKYAEADKKFLEDYVSGEAVRRKPHLDRIVEELFEMNITEDMLRPQYLKDHAGEMHKKVGKMVYFENIYRDPKNRAYFEALPKIKRDFLETRVLMRSASMGSALTYAFACKAVCADHRTYYEKDEKHGPAAFKPLYEPTMEIVRSSIADSKEKEKEYVAEEMERLIKNESVVLMEDARKKKLEAETMEGDIGGLNMTGFVTGFSFDEPSKYRKMIEEHPEAYQKNPELVDWLYQEFYRGIDAMGDFTLRALAVQGAMDQIRLDNEVIHTVEQAVSDALSKEQDKLEVECDTIREQINAFTNAMQAVLRGKELTPAGAAVINRFAVNNERAQM